MRQFISSLLAITIVALLFSTAHADTITQTIPISRTFNSSIGKPTGETYNFRLQDPGTPVTGFNPSLGTLNSFTINWSFAISQKFDEISTINDLSYDCSGALNTYRASTSSIPYGGLINTSDGPLQTINNSLLINFHANNTTTWTPANDVIGGVHMLPYASSGDFNLWWDGPIGFTVKASSAHTVSGTLDGSATITYDYTVPEPTTLGLMMLSGMLLLRRKKIS